MMRNFPETAVTATIGAAAAAIAVAEHTSQSQCVSTHISGAADLAGQWSNLIKLDRVKVCSAYSTRS